MATDTGFGEKSTGNQQIRGKQVTDLILCYLVCPKDAAGGFLGAVLLTDYRARPQHFGYVQPVKPTKLQQILYGTSLEEFIKVDVISNKLWQGLPKKPDVVFVETADLIVACWDKRVPTALIAKVPDSEASSLSALRYDVGPHAEDKDYVGEVLNVLEGNCNLLEPFSRIREALKEVLKAGA